MPPLPEHISVTQIVMYLRCAQQWMYRYPEGLIRPPNMPMVVGGGVHQGIHVAIEHRIATAEYLLANDLRDAAVSGFDERLEKEGLSLLPEEKTIGVPKVIGKGRDQVAAASHHWAVNGQPDYEPVSSEQKFTIDARKAIGRNIVGVIDLTEKNRITDYKVPGKAPSQREADISLQLTGYSLAFFQEHGRLPQEVRLDAIVPLKKGPRRTVRKSTRCRRDCSQFLQRAAGIVRAIDRGDFPACNPADWVCSRRWCGYTDICGFYVPELDKEV